MGIKIVIIALTFFCLPAHAMEEQPLNRRDIVIYMGTNESRAIPTNYRLLLVPGMSRSEIQREEVRIILERCGMCDPIFPFRETEPFDASEGFTLSCTGRIGSYVLMKFPCISTAMFFSLFTTIMVLWLK